MTNTEMYYGLVKVFMKTFDQKCYRFTSDVPTSVLELRANLISEEEEEYLQAKEHSDLTSMLDGLCDLAYVVAGTMACCGINPIPYSSAEKKDIMLSQNVDAVITELGLGVPCHKRLYRYTNKLLACIDDLGSKTRLPDAFKVVHENNMKKLWDFQPLDPSLIYTPKGPNLYLVRRKSDGKIVKPPGFVGPDLSVFVYPAYEGTR